ncbi:MAG TPA: right-handed parallel beta-helix repeat-containing protein [Terracidiphilus sp.]|jgi:hypothetical protein
MLDITRGPAPSFPAIFVLFARVLIAISGASCDAQGGPAPAPHSWFIDCSGPAGDGSSLHPWNSLAAAEAHRFSPGDRIALRRGTTCHGSFAPTGSGNKEAPIRLTAYGEGPRPHIIAASSDRQVLLLSNQEYWQVDSLDLSGANTYGVFVTGDHALLRHIYLENLVVRDVFGGEMKHKDNGLVVIGPSKLGAFFEDVLVDGVDAAHTNQWAGILVGGGPFYIPPDQFINKHIIIRNSTVHDVYGDGIVLFRDAQSKIQTSVAWETGMQPTETTGTPNAIWTWTCTDCTVEDNEAFLTDSPGVDGGAYDIDWSNTRNLVQRNFAHDTQGYCFAVFAAGYITSSSTVRENLCVDNALSPRLAALQGAAYLSTWNGGVIRDLRIENNTFIFNPPVASAAAIVEKAETGGTSIVFTGNHIESSAPLIYRAAREFVPSANSYQYLGSEHAQFTLGNMTSVSLDALQKAGFERGSTMSGASPQPRLVESLRLEATLDFALDSDGLLAPEPRAQLVVLRSLADQYPPNQLRVIVHIRKRPASPQQTIARANALLDLNAASIQFDNNGQAGDTIRLLAKDGNRLHEWQGFQNATELGGAVRKLLCAPLYSRMTNDIAPKEAR